MLALSAETSQADRERIEGYRHSVASYFQEASSAQSSLPCLLQEGQKTALIWKNNSHFVVREMQQNGEHLWVVYSPEFHFHPIAKKMIHLSKQQMEDQSVLALHPTTFRIHPSSPSILSFSVEEHPQNSKPSTQNDLLDFELHSGGRSHSIRSHFADTIEALNPIYLFSPPEKLVENPCDCFEWESPIHKLGFVNFSYFVILEGEHFVPVNKVAILAPNYTFVDQEGIGDLLQAFYIDAHNLMEKKFLSVLSIQKTEGEISLIFYLDLPTIKFGGQDLCINPGKRAISFISNAKDGRGFFIITPFGNGKIEHQLKDPYSEKEVNSPVAVHSIKDIFTDTSIRTTPELFELLGAKEGKPLVLEQPKETDSAKAALESLLNRIYLWPTSCGSSITHSQINGQGKWQFLAKEGPYHELEEITIQNGQGDEIAYTEDGDFLALWDSLQLKSYAGGKATFTCLEGKNALDKTTAFTPFVWNLTYVVKGKSGSCGLNSPMDFHAIVLLQTPAYSHPIMIHLTRSKGLQSEVAPPKFLENVVQRGQAIQIPPSKTFLNKVLESFNKGYTLEKMNCSQYACEVFAYAGIYFTVNRLNLFDRSWNPFAFTLPNPKPGQIAHRIQKVTEIATLNLSGAQIRFWELKNGINYRYKVIFYGQQFSRILLKDDSGFRRVPRLISLEEETNKVEIALDRTGIFSWFYWLSLKTTVNVKTGENYV